MIHPIHFAAKSEIGLVRRVNQDAYHVSAENGLVVVADGMGGHQAGEIASQIAVEGIKKDLSMAHWHNEGDEMQTLLKLGAAVEKANAMICQTAATRKSLRGMGTTIVTALFRLDRIFLAHVGDSRIYRYRDGRLQQITRDHSLIQKLVDAGTFVSAEQALAAGIGSNVLTRALGIEDQVEVDVAAETLQEDDVFLFCSDGLTSMLPDQQIEKLMNHYFPDLEAMVERLCVGAMSAGGQDNITIVLARPDTVTARFDAVS